MEGGHESRHRALAQEAQQRGKEERTAAQVVAVGAGQGGGDEGGSGQSQAELQGLVRGQSLHLVGLVAVGVGCVREAWPS